MWCDGTLRLMLVGTRYQSMALSELHPRSCPTVARVSPVFPVKELLLPVSSRKTAIFPTLSSTKAMPFVAASLKSIAPPPTAGGSLCGALCHFFGPVCPAACACPTTNLPIPSSHEACMPACLPACAPRAGDSKSAKVRVGQLVWIRHLFASDSQIGGRNELTGTDWPFHLHVLS